MNIITIFNIYFNNKRTNYYYRRTRELLLNLMNDNAI